MKNIKQYARVFTVSIIGLFAAIATMNYFIDPYDVWGIACKASFNCKKTQAGNKIYYTKAKQWKDSEINGLIMGNSRTEIGIKPDSQALPTVNNYNLSIRGSSVAIQALYLQNLLKEKKLKYMILGVDFFSFRRLPGSSDKWPVHNRSYLAYDVFGQENDDYIVSNLRYGLTALLSLPAAIDSLLTVANQNRTTSYLRHNGFDEAVGFQTINRIEGVEEAFKNDLYQLIQRFEGKQYSFYDSNGVSSEIEGLRTIINLAKKYDIMLHVFINPVHVEYLKVLEKTGHLHLIDEWKMLLIKTLDEAKELRAFTFHDFSNLCLKINEEVPLGKGKEMKWWFEAGHYRPSLGDFMLTEIFTDSDKYAFQIPGDSSKLSAANSIFTCLTK